MSVEGNWEPIFEGVAPGALGDSILDVPAISTHLPTPGRANGAAMIVAPGGGYRSLASDYEGLQVARWLNRIGIAAFVLRYRVGPKYHSRVSIQDGQQALRYIRQRSNDYPIDPQRVGIIGFSAGGHLALSMSTGWSAQHLDANTGGNFEGSSGRAIRPDVAVGVYAVTNGALRGRKADEYTPTDAAVRADTSPTFLMHTHEDSIVPASQSTLHYNALLRAKVPAELHIFNDGDHGLGLAAGDPDVSHWPRLLHRWLRRRCFLTAEARIEVRGQLLIDGAAPGDTWLTLRPENLNAPAARVRLNRADEGKFLIPCEQGPVSGPHLLELHQVSVQSKPSATGYFSLEDRRFFSREILISPDAPIQLDLSSKQFGVVEDL